MAAARRLSIAPMLDWTDRHARYFFRLLTRKTLLYSEMVTTGAILYGDPERHLAFNSAEHPVALQLGGSDPRELAECSRIGAQFGYDEINLNVGCPSDRVQSGRFGACLMAEPQLVAECVAAMREAVTVPVTIKSRIGIDHQEGYEPLASFVEQVSAAGCEVFIVHARKAWLSGLSPKENREIPPLRYELVHQLKQDFPHLTIIINGGLRNLDEAEVQLAQVDGVMIGRAAYENPFLLCEADRRLYGSPLPDPDPRAVMRTWMDYVQAEWDKGTPLHAMTRHILGAFHGQPGARAFRRLLSEQAPPKGSTPEVLRKALQQVGIEL
ncbi:MAG: tRNA dihydrouridine(20/20a) synthase DusA [Gammaproteobacteria bacterium]|nr:tRNA dihydrouridine(20/20a) synthase DusA [Gammaproteobacteria bacterium]